MSNLSGSGSGSSGPGTGQPGTGARVALVAAAVLVVVFAGTRIVHAAGDHRNSAAASAASSASSLTSSVAAPMQPDLGQGATLVQEYLDDATAGAIKAAMSLICSAHRSSFARSVHAPRSDFEFAWSRARLQAEDVGNPARVILTYSAVATLKSGGQPEQRILRFTLVSEDGPKLCN